MNSILARYNTREAAAIKTSSSPPFSSWQIFELVKTRFIDYRESWLDCRWRRRKLEFNYIWTRRKLSRCDYFGILVSFIYYCILNIYSFFVATQELSFHATHFKPHNSEAVNVLCYYCKSMFHCFTFFSQIPIFDIFLHIRHLVQIWRV